MSLSLISKYNYLRLLLRYLTVNTGNNAILVYIVVIIITKAHLITIICTITSIIIAIKYAISTIITHAHCVQRNNITAIMRMSSIFF